MNVNNPAADFLDSKVRGARLHQSRQPDHASAHGLSAALLGAVAEFLRYGGNPDDIRGSLKVVEIAVEDMEKGLHLPDEDRIEGRPIGYTEGPQT